MALWLRQRTNEEYNHTVAIQSAVLLTALLILFNAVPSLKAFKLSSGPLRLCDVVIVWHFVPD